MKLIGPLVLLALVSLVEGEVVYSFADWCPQFFVKDQNGKTITPSLLIDKTNHLRYQQICQKYGGKYRFATLYDTKNRIPIYSAYLFDPAKGRPHLKWMIEPQLDYATDPAEMAAFGAKQALDEDYKGSDFTRGHLNPNCYNCGKNKKATFTLTNVAPQTEYDNQNWAKEVETPLKEKIKKECNLENDHRAYMVTGVIPGETFIEKQVGDKKIPRVNIPSHYWTAFSCKKKNQNSCMSGGYLLRMTKKIQDQIGSSEGQPKAIFYDSAIGLQKELSTLYKTPIMLFNINVAECLEHFLSADEWEDLRRSLPIKVHENLFEEWDEDLMSETESGLK